MVQYLELIWRQTVEKMGLFFDETSEVAPKEKTEKLDWRDKSGKNWYY